MFNPSMPAGRLGAMFGQLIIHFLLTSVHRTVMNALKSTVKYKLKLALEHPMKA